MMMRLWYKEDEDGLDMSLEQAWENSITCTVILPGGLLWMPEELEDPTMRKGG